jgi:hypothetical protein
MTAFFSCLWSLFTFRLILSGHTAREIMNATFQASRIKKERFETIHQLQLLYQGFAMQATQSGLVLKNKQRQPPAPPAPSTPPPKSRKAHEPQGIAVQFPNNPGRILSPLSFRNNNVPLKRRKQAGMIQHPELGPAMYGNHGSMMMAPPKRLLSPPRTDYRKTPVLP